LSATPTPIKLRAGFYRSQGAKARALLSHRLQAPDQNRHQEGDGGSLTVQRLTAGGSTFETAFKPFSTDSSSQAFLVSGTYQLTINMVTDVSADLFLTDPFAAT
jgi:hypothetical protein